MKEIKMKISELKKLYPNEYKEMEVYDRYLGKWVKYKDSTYESGAGFPKPEEALFPINLITFYSTETDTTYTWGLFEPGKVKDDDIVKNYRNFTDELEMLKDWLHWFNNQSFDVITGWNSVLFDIPYIINRIKRIRGERGIKAEYENLLSPIGKRPEGKDISDKKIGNALGSSYDIPGMVHLDSMELYKTFASHGPLSSFSLNAIAMNELGEGKLEYEGTINTIWQTDPQQFTRYNVVDVIRNKQIILDKCKLFSLIIEYAYDCLVTLDKVYNKVPTTEGYFLRYMHNELKKVMNDRPDHHEDWWRNEECFKVKKPDGTIYYQNCEWEKGVYEFEEFHVKAGYCYDDPGRYDDAMSFDITSSYPHHIMQFNISPEVKVIRPTKEQVESGEVILSDVNEVGFKRTDDAVLPNVVKKVFNERKHYKDLMKKAKKEGDLELVTLYDNRQGVKKIIINSMYGVCLAPGFHLFDIDCARAITRSARVTLRDWLKMYVDKYYPSKLFIKDLVNEYSTVTVELSDGTKKIYNFNDKITVERDGKQIIIQAKDFNKETDLLGIDDEDKV